MPSLTQPCHQFLQLASTQKKCPPDSKGSDQVHQMYASIINLAGTCCWWLLQVAQAHGTLPPVMQEDAERKQQERLFGPAARAALGAQWNSLVDNTLGRLAQELAKRGI